VEVDVSVIPATLFESELFGYRPGAFTGASEGQPGRVARAEGGTLVLDHLEELPLAAQPKLLRLLAERRYTPLGGSEVAADVRFVAIASEDLPERAERGIIRQDLFYRLEVLAFRVPPLRERRGDLPALIDHLLSDLGDRLGRRLELHPASREGMLEHPWPGNVTQLRGVLEREAVLTVDGPLRPKLPRSEVGARPRALVEVEREEILKALAFTRGHQGRAAELLGISRKALWEKRKRLGLP
jgi:DNA-binding NtrC family response regulator